jgi:hypothetical protein
MLYHSMLYHCMPIIASYITASHTTASHTTASHIIASYVTASYITASHTTASHTTLCESLHVIQLYVIPLPSLYPQNHAIHHPPSITIYAMLRPVYSQYNKQTPRSLILFITKGYHTNTVNPPRTCRLRLACTTNSPPPYAMAISIFLPFMLFHCTNTAPTIDIAPVAADT